MFNSPEIVDEALCQGVIGVEGSFCCMFECEGVLPDVTVYSINILPRANRWNCQRTSNW